MAICERCGVSLESGDEVVFTPISKLEASVTVCQECASAVEAKLLPKVGVLNIVGGLLLGAGFAVIASIFWYFIYIYS
jgi:hypothetical protein